ncbi:MAG TPA: ComEC/Rec2 family competence protein [Candidatus Omnitrophota bacterium]|nr:ComEC/Rec2 family competence protein [Candidatus Omnitrophota bacterium]
MKKIILALIFFFLCKAACLSQEALLKIHFIDIGEGDSILIQHKDRNVLIDTGNILSGYKLVDYLKNNKVSVIDHLIITHPDLDHLSGVFFVLPKLKVENLYDNGCNLGSLDNPMLNWYTLIFRRRENYRVLKEGDALKLDDCLLKVLWPQDRISEGSFNHNSLVMRLDYKNFSCLFTADLDKAAEVELLNKKIDLKVDLLKVGHHGAADATSEEFLNKVSPQVAIISVDKNNPRGYPAESVLGLFRQRGIKAFRTDMNGSILITVDEEAGYRAVPER